MGLSNQLIVFPLVALTICVIVSGGGGFTYQGSVAPFCVSGQSALQCTSSASSASPGALYTCISGSGCFLPYDCPSSPPPPSYCFGGPGGQWFLPGGDAVFIPANAISSLGPPTGGSASDSLVFGAINVAGFIVMIGIVTTVVVIGAIDFFGTGENAEGVHIAWMTALLLGLWGFLSAADGFVTGSPASFFIQLNTLVPGIGTLSYIFLTFLYTLGVVGSVSRSSGAGGGGV